MPQTDSHAPGPWRRQSRTLRAVAALYAAAVALVVLWPEPVDRPAARGIATTLVWLHAHGLPRWFGYAQLEWLSNVAFFVPFGVLALALGMRPWLALLAGVAASASAETAQALLLPDRTASLMDVLANGTGTLVGIAGTLAVRRLVARPDSLGRSERRVKSP